VVVRLQSAHNDGHFTDVAETLVRTYLPSHCSWVTEIFYVGLPACLSRTLEVRLNCDCNEGLLTLEAEKIFSSVSHFALQWGD
jgi:hypothetical protein